MAKAKKATGEKAKKKQIEIPFYLYLRLFLEQERKKIYSKFTTLSKKFLNFNNPENKTSYLRLPQFEALETYVFLKEFCNNKYLHEIFENWFYRKEEFEGRSAEIADKKGQLSFLMLKGAAPFLGFESNHEEDKEIFKGVFEQIKSYKQTYPNYIFALTMGLGKTVLMATCIFYEFLLANKYPKDPKYAHNALVFAPDKTVLQSLKEIQTLDKSLVVPPEYVSWLESNLKFHFLDETGNALNAIERSKYNIIISNTQKIILKKESTEKSVQEKVFYDDLAREFELDSETSLISNQRFSKLLRLEQLAIYVDEAHHVFGKALSDELISTSNTKSLRITINKLAEYLKEANTSLVACYNYTGTPYVNNALLPEVVYSYGLREAIENGYLKKVSISGHENIQDQTLPFVRLVINEFVNNFKDKLYEGMLPKIAFFASTIEELDKELKPAVEKVLSELNISTNKILVNVGDPKLTSNDDLREFRSLDSVSSDKQFLLLVNKGKEGWNCRSLFGVALHRKPKSRIFVLQATMRCLRKIGIGQNTGYVYLSSENHKILQDELEENFRVSLDDLNPPSDDKVEVQIRVTQPPVKVKMRRIQKMHNLKEKKLAENIDLNLSSDELQAKTDTYRIIRSEFNLDGYVKSKADISHIRERRIYSSLTLTAEIARYLNLSPILIKFVLERTVDGLEAILEKVNEFNEVLYDWVIPKLFKEFYEIQEFERTEEKEIELVKTPPEGFYTRKAKQEDIVNINDPRYDAFKGQRKSFHLDNYCFDSKPENEFFWRLVKSDKVKEVWFTGMLSYGESDFVISYIDPESHTVRNYYPDFLVTMQDNSILIIEVKADHKIDDLVVKAKQEYAEKIALVSQMRYQLIPSSKVSTFSTEF